MSLVLQNFNFSSSLKRRTQSSVNSSASFSLTGLDFPVGFSIKPNDGYFKCDQKQEANSPRFCFRLVFPSENLHPIPSRPPFTKHKPCKRIHKTRSKHIHIFNVRFNFSPYPDFPARGNLKLDLIWGLRCWMKICMFLSNKWRTLERLWLSMLKGLPVGWIFRCTHTHTHKYKYRRTHRHIFLFSFVFTGQDLVYVFLLFWFFCNSLPVLHHPFAFFSTVSFEKRKWTARNEMECTCKKKK